MNKIKNIKKLTVSIIVALVFVFIATIPLLTLTQDVFSSGKVPPEESNIDENLTIQNIEATPIAYNKVKVSWESVANAKSYKVYLSTSIHGEYSATAELKENFIDVNVATASTMYFKVKAFSDKKESNFSSIVNATPFIANTQITKAVCDKSKVNKLVWKEVPGATGYYLFKYDKIGGAFKNIAEFDIKGKVNFTDQKIKEGHKYRYTVRPYIVLNGVKMFAKASSNKDVFVKPLPKPVVKKIEKVNPVAAKKVNPVASNKDKSTNKSRTRVIRVQASAYTGGGTTASGLPAQVGRIAVDPRVIPLGTKVYVPGYGMAVAADTGGIIKGNRIDLYMNTYQECINFGRRYINVTVYY